MQAVEKFAQNAEAMSGSFTRAVKRFEELELPHEVPEMEAMVRCCLAERKELLDDFGSSTTHGHTLLNCIRGQAQATPLGNLGHVLELERSVSGGGGGGGGGGAVSVCVCVFVRGCGRMGTHVCVLVCVGFLSFYILLTLVELTHTQRFVEEKAVRGLSAAVVQWHCRPVIVMYVH